MKRKRFTDPAGVPPSHGGRLPAGALDALAGGGVRRNAELPDLFMMQMSKGEEPHDDVSASAGSGP